MSMRCAVLAVSIACVLFTGCAKNYTRRLGPDEVALRKITDARKIPDFRPAYAASKSDPGLVQSIDQSIFYFSHPSSKGYFPYLDVTHDRAVQSLKAFKELLATAVTAEDFQRRIVQEFDVYESVGCDDRGTVLYTGYCTPIYEASLKPTAQFRFPLYRKPADLVKDERTGLTLGKQTKAGALVPYPTRAELEGSGVLVGLELVYLKDRLEAYLVHVQGSAKLKLIDGGELTVGYEAKNGREYKSLGQMLAQDRKINPNKVSLTAIKDYFKKNPQDLDKYLPRNESFIFFQRADGGPYGSLGVPVTTIRSIATDKSGSREIYPRGCLAFIQTKLPEMGLDGKIDKLPYNGFILDQDTGGAIRSAGRADVYMGVGPRAEMLAGHTVAEGRIYYLFVKGPLIDRPM